MTQPSTLPKPLQQVLGRAAIAMNRRMSDLEKGLDVDSWYDQFSSEIERYHREALQTGLRSRLLDEQALNYLDNVVEGQIEFLDTWKLEIEENEGEFKQGWKARAALYAMSVRQDYWTGVSHFLPLPAMPGDGSTQCLSNCNCYWEITWLDETKGDADAYWRNGPGKHCQTCLVRSEDWAPIQVRDWVLVVTKSWPKGRKLGSAHRAAISRSLRGRGHGGGSVSPSAPSDDPKKAAKRLRAQKRREAAKAGMTAKAPEKTPKAPKSTDTAKPEVNSSLQAKLEARRQAKKDRAAKRRDATKVRDQGRTEEPKVPPPLVKTPRRVGSKAAVTGTGQSEFGSPDYKHGDSKADLYNSPKYKSPPESDEITQKRAKLSEANARISALVRSNASPEQRKIANDQVRAQIVELHLAQAKAQAKANSAIQVERHLKILPKDRNDAGVKREIEMLNKIPPALHARMANTGMETFIGTGPSTSLDSNQHLANQQPRGWPPGSTMDRTGGFYSPFKNQTTVSVNGNGMSTSSSVALHEYGHAVGQQLHYDDHAQVKLAHDAMFHKLSPYLTQGGKGAPAGRQEFFAEAFSTTVVNADYARHLYGDAIVNFIQKEIIDAHK